MDDIGDSSSSLYKRTHTLVIAFAFSWWLWGVYFVSPTHSSIKYNLQSLCYFGSKYIHNYLTIKHAYLFSILLTYCFWVTLLLFAILNFFALTDIVLVKQFIVFNKKISKLWKMINKHVKKFLSD